MDIDVRDLPYYVRVRRVAPLPGYRLDIEFDDGNRGVYDMTPYLDKGIFRGIRDERVFNRVHVAFGVVTWNDEIDISSERLWTDCVPVGKDWRRELLPSKYFSGKPQSCIEASPRTIQ